MLLKILSFNIHKGVGWISRKSTMQAICHLLIQKNPDIILLQEVRDHQFDMIAKSNLHGHLKQNVYSKKGNYGNAIFSKWPLKFIKNVDLSMHRFERRSMMHVILKQVGSHRIHLVCVHLGLFRDDRKKQMEKIIHYVKSHIDEDDCLILGGDFNDWNSFATQLIARELNLTEAFFESKGCYANTYPAWAPVLKLDRIYARGFVTVNVLRLTEKRWRLLSDHIAIEADLYLPNAE